VNSSPRFIGYDSRALPEHLGGEWDDARKQAFLLRPDVEQPLSVDTMVWPAMDDLVFPDSHEQFGYGFLGLVARAIPPEACSGVCVAIGTYPDTWTPVQKTVWDSTIRSKEGRNIGVDYLMGETVSAPDPGAFEFLGFDVADAFLLSGLTNCGWKSEEANDAWARWATHLNEAHLFKDRTAADEFARYADTRVSEHAPFYVYGIWVQSR
jgi:hypothetical protein